jgi:DNA-directed RNA polymerase specialized sigma subunit
MVTREQLAELTYLQQEIEELKSKILYLQSHPPLKEYGKVYGSDSNFPYTVRSYTVEGYNGINEDKWLKRRRDLEAKLQNKLIEYEKMRIEIEEFIQNVPDITTRLMFSYLYIDGMKQEEVAQKLHFDRSTVSKRISSYLDTVIK